MWLAPVMQQMGSNQDSQNMASLAARLPRPAADGLDLNPSIPCPLSFVLIFFTDSEKSENKAKINEKAEFTRSKRAF